MSRQFRLCVAKGRWLISKQGHLLGLGHWHYDSITLVTLLQYWVIWLLWLSFYKFMTCLFWAIWASEQKLGGWIDVRDISWPPAVPNSKTTENQFVHNAVPCLLLSYFQTRVEHNLNSKHTPTEDFFRFRQQEVKYGSRFVYQTRWSTNSFSHVRV